MGVPLEATSILLFGPGCVGKSTVGRALALRLPRCAYLEVDELRYKVAGGLVALSAGTSPGEDPDEYARQCALGERNAVALCHGFAEEGFSSVVEGLGEDCLPGTGWIEEHLRTPVRSALLVCTDEELERRWPLDGRNPRFLPFVLKHLAWFRERTERFDVVLDTTALQHGEAAERLQRELFEGAGFPQRAS